MTNTKKSLLASGLSLAVSVALLAGTTFAWFTDSVTNKGNVIQAGSLSINAYAYELGTGGQSFTVEGINDNNEFTFESDADRQDLKTDTTPIINENFWEPGKTSAKLLKVENAGTLAAKIKLDFYTDGDLTDALWFDFIRIKNGKVTGDFTRRPMSTLASFAEKIELPLLRNENLEFLLIYGMNEDAGNEYQGGIFTADVSILATQYTSETDGFGNSDYDKNAEYDIVATPGTISDVLAAAQNGDVIKLSEGTFNIGNENLYLTDVTIIGSGAGKTVINGSLKFGVNNSQTVYEGGQWTVKGVTIINNPKDPAQIAISLAGNEKSSENNIILEDCEIKDFVYGVQLGGSPVTDSMLSVKNTVFENVWCAISVGQEGNEFDAVGCSFIDCTYQLQDYRNGNEYFPVIGGASAGSQTPPYQTDWLQFVAATDNALSNGAALQKAVKKAPEGGIICLGNGVFDLPKDEETKLEGQTGWLLPIMTDGITIKGSGNTVIKSSDATPNGAYASQNVITVFADDIKLEDLIIEPRASQNKNVEVNGMDFTMKNCTVKVGSLYFAGNKGTVTVQDSRFEQDSCICFDSMADADNVVIENNTFNGCVYYAIGNQTWSSPATLTMADVTVKGNTFENVSNVLRHRMAYGTFKFDGTNTLDGKALDAVLLAQYTNFDPHGDLTAEQLKNRLIATVNGQEIRVGTDLLTGQNSGWTDNTTFDFGWSVNKDNTGLDAVADTRESTIKTLVAVLKDKDTENVLQIKNAKLDMLLFGDDGVVKHPQSWNKGWMSNRFLTRAASDGDYWNATAMTATMESNPDTIVTIVMQHTNGTVYSVRY